MCSTCSIATGVFRKGSQSSGKRKLVPPLACVVIPSSASTSCKRRSYTNFEHPQQRIAYTDYKYCKQ
ncbi:hypothetical protein CEXT_612761 [Caerostris extrusa]|uniref:Uncharacterized protein n=1 Tax=Caerostris extrusa TaxID=172846 RepID=A0AAV4ME43_CAEEX|nr:hypothetical protein CEXT_612761 [Caerostris extrusa]